ncbi:MlaC/ttg2D family ABC transporter substrate-binding protein [Frateuria aurantia]
MLRRLVFATALSLGTLTVLPLQAQAQDAAATAQNPGQLMQSISSQLGAAIDGHRQQYQAHPDQLPGLVDSILLPHFDVDYAAILVLGLHAREATPEQRSRFAKAFYNSLTHRYADGLLNYSSNRMKVLPFTGDANVRRAVVRCQAKLDNGKEAEVDFVFHKTASGDWKAYDVIIEGISYITNYRNQVDAQIRKEGLDALIHSLETQGDTALKQMESAKPSGGQ